MINDDKRIVSKFGTFCNTLRICKIFFSLEFSKAILTYRAACFVHSLQALRWKPRCNPQSPLIISLDGDAANDSLKLAVWAVKFVQL